MLVKSLNLGLVLFDNEKIGRFVKYYKFGQICKKCFFGLRPKTANRKPQTAKSNPNRGLRPKTGNRSSEPKPDRSGLDRILY